MRRNTDDMRILYKNGRMHTHGVSFPLVEGFYFNPECGVELNSGMAFINEDRTVSIAWEAYEADGDAKGGLEEIINTGGFKLVTPIKEFEYNGLTGCYCMYKDNLGIQYFEAHWNLEPDCELVFCVETEKGGSIKEIMKQEFIRELVRSVKKEILQ